jgi:uncharacterized membrane protein YqaE (UPF0057 family)
MRKIIYICLAITLIASCTVQKRVHNSGYHVQWKGGYSTADKNEFESNIEGKEENLITSDVKNNKVEEILLANSSTGNNIEEVNNVATFEKKEVENKIIKVDHTTASTAKTFSKKANVISKAKTLKKATKKSKKDDDTILLYILCFLIPPIAVGLATNWDEKTLIINIILTLLCGIPGIIHALIVVSDNR